MTQTAADKAPKPTGERTPIPCAKLIFQHANPHGVHVPFGAGAKSEKQMPRLIACEEGGIRTEIDYMPWVRSYRVKRWQKTTRTEKGKELTDWEALKTYFIPEALAVWIPLEDM